MTCYHRITFTLSLFSCILFLYSQADKPYERCQFAAKLAFTYNITQPFVDIWVCVTEALKRNEKKVKMNIDGSKSFGIYRIRSGIWCEHGRRGGDCDTVCENFLRDDLNDDISCAFKIFEIIGFNYWPEFDIYCRDPLVLPQVSSECNLNIPRMDLSYTTKAPKSKHGGKTGRKGIGWGGMFKWTE